MDYHYETRGVPRKIPSRPKIFAEARIFSGIMQSWYAHRVPFYLADNTTDVADRSKKGTTSGARAHGKQTKKKNACFPPKHFFHRFTSRPAPFHRGHTRFRRCQSQRNTRYTLPTPPTTDHCPLLQPLPPSLTTHLTTSRKNIHPTPP